MVIWVLAALLLLGTYGWVRLSAHLAEHIGGWWRVVAAAGIIVLSLAAFATVAGAW